MDSARVTYHDRKLYEGDVAGVAQHAAFHAVIRMESSITLTPNQHYTAQSSVHVTVPEGLVGFISPVKTFAIRDDSRRRGALRVGANIIHGGFSDRILIDINSVGVDDIELRRGDAILQIVFVPCAVVHLTM